MTESEAGRDTTALLDVNLLVALFDPEHIHHETAHRWFGGAERHKWATCPLTENGLVRVLSSPGYPGRRTSLADAIRRLELFCQHQDHIFWQDSVTIRNADLVASTKVQGYRQLTDTYLLALAVSHGGTLVTFDRSIQTTTVHEAGPESLILLI